MAWLAALRRWRRGRLLRRLHLDEALWLRVLERYPPIAALDAARRAALRDLVLLFLHDKAIPGAGGLEVTEAMRLSIAAQACLLVLGLDLDYYRGWVEVIVYPDEFVARYEYVDEYGVAHDVAKPMTGESWERGPVILSWADAAESGSEQAYNVVIHEFAHKLDMLNGDANGFPPLHADMSRQEWARVFTAAYEDLQARIDAREELAIDDYAAESPAEFFAVVSEVFFVDPHALLALYPAVYGELRDFYRQDPAARMPARAPARGRRPAERP
jgi:Mlc titration factor MtfA (ptsG expression regulator)